VKVRRALLLLRVSTDDQHPENQRPELEQLAKARQLEVLEVIEEKATTRKKRPELERILQDAHRGRFDVLVVWALDRLGRSMVGNLQLVRELAAAGVQVISHRESWLDLNPESPVRPLLIAIFSWVAEQERRRLGERVIAGLDRVRAQGFKLGRPTARVDVARARQLLDGPPPRKMGDVAGELDVSVRTLRRALAVKREAPKTHSELVEPGQKPLAENAPQPTEIAATDQPGQ
jgi:putative DNA-invertase from lambdoid prophage Rac